MAISSLSSSMSKAFVSVVLTAMSLSQFGCLTTHADGRFRYEAEGKLIARNGQPLSNHKVFVVMITPGIGEAFADQVARTTDSQGRFLAVQDTGLTWGAQEKLFLGFIPLGWEPKTAPPAPPLNSKTVTVLIEVDKHWRQLLVDLSGKQQEAAPATRKIHLGELLIDLDRLPVAELDVTSPVTDTRPAPTATVRTNLNDAKLSKIGEKAWSVEGILTVTIENPSATPLVVEFGQCELNWVDGKGRRTHENGSKAEKELRERGSFVLEPGLTKTVEVPVAFSTSDPAIQPEVVKVTAQAR